MIELEDSNKFTNADLIRLKLQKEAIQDNMQYEVEAAIAKDKVKSQVRLQKEIIGAVVTKLNLNDDGEIDLMELEKDNHTYLIASISYNLNPQDDTAIEIKEKKK